MGNHVSKSKKVKVYNSRDINDNNLNNQSKNKPKIMITVNNNNFDDNFDDNLLSEYSYNDIDEDDNINDKNNINKNINDKNINAIDEIKLSSSDTINDNIDEIKLSSSDSSNDENKSEHTNDIINILEYEIYQNNSRNVELSVPLNISSTEMISAIKSKPNKYKHYINASKSKKLCCIFCNSYDNTPHALGDPAKNDGILTYLNTKHLGYETHLYHDIKRNDFVNIFTEYVKEQKNINRSQILIYYIGHGVKTFDRNGDESDGYDECLYFKDGTVIDDKLFDIIDDNIDKCSSNKLYLISDCCHSGTIWDIPLEYKNVVTLSASMDHETAKQDVIEFSKGGNRALIHGIFTYYFWKYYVLGGDNLMNKLSDSLKNYRQQPVSNIDFAKQEFVL